MSELIIAYGDENVEFQNLDHATTNLSWSMKKGRSVVTFETTCSSSIDGLDKLGLVLWFDRKKVQEIAGAS